MNWMRAIKEWDSMMLFWLCVADMASTLYWVHCGAAREANPWLAGCLRHGDVAFCLQKMLSFLPLLLFCAYWRTRRPRLVALSLRATVALYVVIYVCSVVVCTYF